LIAKINKEIKASDIVVIQDTRERTPLDLTPLIVIQGTLSTGDYSVKGLEDIIAVERKSLADLVMCVGRERERFDREVLRLQAYPVKALVVEAHLADIEAGAYRSKVKPNAVLGSLLGWMASGLPVLFAGDHAAAGKLTARFLFIAARRRWRESLALIEGRKVS
jgi:ERCC4-type nuclease